ncbi:MAG TPA: AtpZ/AtpI family protein [Chitinophagaceae bacterium]|nr:AtpZ/AtpI family protein [Chitinophagaceae bacterium]
MKYAGLASQLLASIGVAVFIGFQIDKWLHTKPVFICILPILVLVVIFYKLFKETGKESKHEKK